MKLAMKTLLYIISEEKNYREIKESIRTIKRQRNVI